MCCGVRAERKEEGEGRRKERSEVGESGGRRRRRATGAENSEEKG